MNYKNIYVCEGMMDEDKLKKIGCTYVIATGGKFIREPILSFVSNVGKVRNIIIITDPDTPGKTIAAGIKKRVPSCDIINADKEKAIKGKKLGIAEMNTQDIYQLLQKFIENDNKISETSLITKEDFINLGLTGPGGKERRMILVNKYNIPFTSGKNVLDALRMLALTKETIKEDLTK